MKKFDREREFLAQREIYVGIPPEERDAAYLCEQIDLLKEALRSLFRRYNVLAAENDRLKKVIHEESLAVGRERYHARKRGNGAGLRLPSDQVAE